MRRQGFTLIELLTVLALLAMVGLAIYGNLDAGIRVMKKLSGPAEEANLYVFLEKFSSDLQNAFIYNGLPFHGEQEKLSFATTLRTEEKLGGERGIGRVSYAYNSHKKAIDRVQENLSQVYTRESDPSTRILDQIISLKFRYYKYDSGEQRYFWEEEWDEVKEKNKNPLAVKMELEFEDEEGDHLLTRTVALSVTG